jgi:hypothetical protein
MTRVVFIFRYSPQFDPAKVIFDNCDDTDPYLTLRKHQIVDVECNGHQGNAFIVNKDVRFEDRDPYRAQISLQKVITYSLEPTGLV